MHPIEIKALPGYLKETIPVNIDFGYTGPNIGAPLIAMTLSGLNRAEFQQVQHIMSTLRLDGMLGQEQTATGNYTAHILAPSGTQCDADECATKIFKALQSAELIPNMNHTNNLALQSSKEQFRTLAGKGK